MYPGVRLVVICLFIYLYILLIYYFFEGFSKNVCIIKSTHVVCVLPINNLEDNSSHFANHDVIG